jgi:dienelactone hydrolase
MPNERFLSRALSRLLMSSTLLACNSGTTTAAPPTAEILRLFDYDAKAPLDVQVVSTQKERALTVQEITYASPKGGRVPATLIVPDGRGPFAGILLMHGLPGTRAGTLPEARELAKRGAVTLAIDAPFSRPSQGEGSGFPLHFDARDREDQIQLIVDWRRGVDLLLARKDVDPKRLAYVGRSYGGAMGGLLAGVEKRIKAFALVVGDGGLVSHFTGADDHPGPLDRLSPEVRKRWLDIMEPIEPLRFVGRAAPAHLLFQNGRTDELVPLADGRVYQKAGSKPKTLLWYDAGHGLNDQATRDRHAWLAREVGLKKAGRS